MAITVYHNSKCGTSRKVLELIKEAGHEPEVVEYMKTGWTKPQLLELFAAADLTPRDAMRTVRSPAEELGLLDPALDDDALLDAMVEHPALVNRPIVSSPKGVRLCRPAELVQPLLD
jgi:arsenate reductase